jgi:UDP-glucose:(heptosyl)LPS alpha-1,3-glucosyltransferase
MPAPERGGAVVYRAGDGIDAIDEYSRRLTDAMCANGSAARYFPGGVSSVLATAETPRWILLQYNPFSYGRSGFAPGLVRDVARLRRRSRARLAVMVHEAWVGMTDSRSTLVGLWQRAQLRALLRLADSVMTSTQTYAREIGGAAVHVPIGTTITPVPTSSSVAREQLGLDGRLAVALFGRANPARALDHAEAAIAAIAQVLGADRLAILNLGADAPPVRVPSGVEVYNPGRLTGDELSLRLWASDVVLLPFTDGVSTRRTTLMAALAHGRPVLGLRGRHTDAVLAEAQDALVLTPAGDPAAFSRAAVELAGDRRRLRAIGDAGHRLYKANFDWPVVARQVASVLETIPPERPAARVGVRASAGSRRPAATETHFPFASASDESREVIFVAHDVGGSGGMERQAEELVRRLLDAGRPVTVIARTCAVEGREGLRFLRVPTPRRPAPLGYAAFFMVASLLLPRRSDALLHTMGAIVANRVDVATVQYCHRAAITKVDGSRASRPGRPYRINAAVAGILSRTGEAWCYRRGRTRLLCAASGGVARELREQFPAMQGAVRTIPNGVDAVVFRPDPAARRTIRTELGVDERTPLALFVGGDWERKGLSHAVDALALAPEWQLAVAGAGDPEPLASRARAAGSESRLRFLGQVENTPHLYAAGDAFLLPTAYEAFPLVALEAAASGLPLLVTPVNGAEDLIEDGRNGWFISRDGQDIARRLNELRSEPELARAMAEGARAAATGFSWKRMADGYVSLYAELAHGT